MNDVELAAALKLHSEIIKGDFRGTTSALFRSDRSTGKLSSSFDAQLIRRNADIIGVSFNLPRYGYILHHGIKSKTIKQKEHSVTNKFGTTFNNKGRTYTTKGTRKTDYINQVLDRHIGTIADTVAKYTADKCEAVIRF